MQIKQVALVVVSILMAQLCAYAADQGEPLNTPPPDAARKLVQRGVELAERDRVDEAISAFKKAIVLAPDYVRAHAWYIKMRVYFQGRYDEVRDEYDNHMKRSPGNPVYPMAFFLGQSLAADNSARLKKTAELAPEWAWGHYAKALLLLGKDNEAALGELLKSIEKNPSEPAGYLQAIHFQRNILKRVDAALATAEKMAAQPNLRTAALEQLWLLRLVKAQWSDDAKQSLRQELATLAAATSDVNLLAAIRLTYLNLLTDSPGANPTEARLRQLDPAWYPERGKVTALLVTSESGIPRQVVAANRQTAILNKMEAIDQGAAPGEKIARLESLLAEKPKPEIKQVIYERLLRAVAEARDKNAVVKYGETLLTLAPNDTAVRAEVALALADERTDLPKALRYARQAVATTAEFQPAQRPNNTDDSQFRAAFTETKQRENYQQQRALALEALGWALHQTGDYQRAESALRESVELRWSESNLSRLSENLLKQGRAEEAQKMAAEAKKIFVESITRRFTSTPAKDFTIEGIDGRTYKLSDLKGKAILINFWATWCAPCRAELPLLNKAYERYKDQGFEVLAVSVDDKPFRHTVAPFARQNRMNFPVVFADEGHRLYNISSYPTSIFVDRQGNVRYQQRGAFTDERVLEIIVTELLR